MNRLPLQTIARALTDGTDVDWDSAEGSTDPADREAVRQLRLVASIGSVARSMALRWGPFELRQVVGQGTFATVYRAWDPKVDREIALKLLNEGIGPGPQAGAIHEARLLATAEHPNVVPVYGADIHDGRVGIWMKFIHGGTLKEILTRQGPLGAEEAALIGRDLCLAIEAMHRRGLVHRDIKAQNVMREIGGRIVLMDFGAGRTLAGVNDTSLQGSPAYLAPEVVAGQPATAQSDIYSLAVLLYHLVTGEFPVVARSWPELRALHAGNVRRRLADARPDLPRWFVIAVDRGLAATPEERPGSAGELFGLLQPERPSILRRRPAIAALLLMLLVAAVYGGWSQARRPAPAVSRAASIYIEPFENLTGSPELDFLSRGLAGRVASRLTALPGVGAMVPSNSIKASGGSSIAGASGRETLLTCRISGSARRIKVGCELARIRSSMPPTRIDTSEHTAGDLLAVESELARRIAFALKVPLSADDTRRLAATSVSAEALSHYLHGRHEWAFRTDEALNRSISHYHDALRVAPDFALAYSGIADAYSLLGAYGFLSRPRAYALAFDAASRAVELDPTIADAQFSLGYAQKNRFDWPAAEASFRRGLELNPDSSLGHHWFSIYLTQMGRFQDAIAEAKHAIALDPSSLAARTHFATLLVLARRYRDGIAQWEACIDLGSNQVNTYRALSKAYLYLGDRRRAVEFGEDARSRAQGGAPDEELKADLAYVFAVVGRRDEAIELADELVLRHRAAGEAIAGSIAAVYTGLGEYEEAFKWLTIAVREQDPELGYLLVDPKWDPLRQDARFTAALASVGFSIK